MRARVEVDGKAFDVELRRVEGTLVAIVEGERFPVRVDGGATAVVRVGKDTHTVALCDARLAVLDGAETPFAILELAGVGGPAGAAADGKVRPPMTGRLDSLRVKEGQDVARGDVLFVVEAMKMRNEVRSPLDGKVARVHAKPGETVEPGRVVVELVAA